jgi:hypothetical protein
LRVSRNRIQPDFDKRDEATLTISQLHRATATRALARRRDCRRRGRQDARVPRARSIRKSCGHNVSAQQVAEAIRNSNIIVSPGLIEEKPSTRAGVDQRPGKKADELNDIVVATSTTRRCVWRRSDRSAVSNRNTRSSLPTDIPRRS